MLTIRFNRVGRRNRAYYRIVVQEHNAAPGGRHVAVVGSHDPHAKKTILKEEEIKHWLDNGAQPSDTVHNLLVKHGIIRGKKRPKGKIVVPEVAEEKTEEKTAEVKEEKAEEKTEEVKEEKVEAKKEDAKEEK